MHKIQASHPRSSIFVRLHKAILCECLFTTGAIYQHQLCETVFYPLFLEA